MSRVRNYGIQHREFRNTDHLKRLSVKRHIGLHEKMGLSASVSLKASVFTIKKLQF